jgi:diketogulonate reductase-like aldo/keto reductase
MLPLTGTSDADHMRADLAIHDFCLTHEEIEQIKGLAMV